MTSDSGMRAGSPDPEVDAKFELFVERVIAAAEQVFGYDSIGWVLGVRVDNEDAVRLASNLNSADRVEYALTELHQVVAQYAHIQGLEGLQVEGGSEAEIELQNGQAAQEDDGE